MKRAHNDLLRRAHFAPGNYIPKTWQLKRARGRPRFEWTNLMGADVSSILTQHGTDELQYFSGNFDMEQWELWSSEFCRQL